MALDEPRENDNVFDVNGFQFVVEKEFYEKAKPVTVDFMGYGFRISSSINLGAERRLRRLPRVLQHRRQIASVGLIGGGIRRVPPFFMAKHFVFGVLCLVFGWGRLSASMFTALPPTTCG